MCSFDNQLQDFGVIQTISFYWTQDVGSALY